MKINIRETLQEDTKTVDAILFASACVVCKNLNIQTGAPWLMTPLHMRSIRVLDLPSISVALPKQNLSFTLIIQLVDLPYLSADCFIASDPKMLMICINAVMSSWALKKGYRPLKMDRNITPAAHMSTAKRDGGKCQENSKFMLQYQATKLVTRKDRKTVRTVF